MTPRKGGTAPAPALVIWVTVATVVSGGLFVWPLHVVMVAGQDSDLVLIWVGLWLAAITVLSPSAASLAGRWATINRILGIGASVGLIGMDVIILDELAGMLQTFYYFETPRWALILPIVCLIVWGARGVGATLWSAVFLVIPVLLGVTGLTLAIALTNFHFGRVLLPNQVMVLPAQLDGLLVVAYLGLPLGVTLRSVIPLLATPPSLGDRVWAAVVPWTLLGALYSVTMGSIGNQALVHLRWPVVFTLDHVTLDSTFFLSRIGLVVVFGWTVGVALGLMVHLRVFLMTTHQTLGMRTRYGPLAVGIFWTMGTFALPSPDTATTLLLQVFDPLCAIYLFMEMSFLCAWRSTHRHG